LLPLLVGIHRPAVVLPARLIQEDPTALRLMLAHELAHHRRRDLCWAWLPTLTQVLFFFHPLVWLARGEEELAREIACDILAVRVSGAPAMDYGTMLLHAVTRRGQTHDTKIPLAALGIADSVSTLKKRLVGLQNSAPVTPRGRLVFTLIISTALLSLVPWRVVAQRPVAKTALDSASSRVPAGGLRGVVLTPDNKPAAGTSVAWMVWINNGARAVDVAQTDAEGRFHLQPDSAQGYQKGPFAGHIVAWGSGCGLSTKLVEQGESSITVHLLPASSLEVTFLDSGSRPISDLPVSAAWLSGDSGDFPLQGLENLPSSFPKFSGSTGQRGSIRFRDLPQGSEVRLKVAHSRYAMLATGDTIPLPSGTAQTSRVIRLQPGAALSGRATFGPNNKPAPNITVNAIYQDPAKRAGEGWGIREYQGNGTRTDSEGRYTISNLRPGPHRVFVNTFGKPLTAPARKAVSAVAGKNTGDVNFVLTPGVLVTGTVTDKPTGKPAAGIWVGGGYANEGPQHYSFWAVTDSKGQYKVRVPTGRAMVHLRQNRGFRLDDREVGHYSRIINAQRGREYKVNFRVSGTPGPGPIAGRVLGPEGRPAANAEVHLFPFASLPSGITRTDAQGRFRFPRASSEGGRTPLTLRARTRDGLVTIKGVPAEPNEYNYTLRLVRGAAVALGGRVVNRDSQPISRADLYLVAFGAGGKNVSAEAFKSDRQGKFSTPPLWPDLGYAVRARAVGYGQSRSDYYRYFEKLRPGETRILKPLVLRPADQVIAGRVVSASGAPVAAVTLELSGRETPRQTLVTDSDGRFHFDNVVKEPVLMSLRYLHRYRLEENIRPGQTNLTIVAPQGTTMGRTAR
jgi:5-hydroxyisourate hydrolase-like protein (transthyretin family)